MVHGRGTSSTRRDANLLTMSERLIRSVSQKLRRKKPREKANEEEGSVSVKCLSLYGRVGNCRVGADTVEEYTSAATRRRSSSSSVESGFDCFSRERFWRRNTQARKEQSLEESVQNSMLHIFLPDDILELCLLRLPFKTLMAARLVCKKWRHLTTTPRFLGLRRERENLSTWLFLVGSNDIHALDVTHNKWHKIDSGILNNRVMFSVANTKDELIVIGGCSALDRAAHKTHREVLAYSPLTNTWRKVPSLKHPRTSPVVAVSDAAPPVKRLMKLRTDRLKQGKRFVILVVGGLGSWDEHLDTGEIYDSSTNKWSDLPKLPPDAGVVSCGVASGSTFYIYSEADKLVGYDLERGHWSMFDTTPSPPRVREYCPKLVACEGRVYMVCVSWCDGEGQIGHRNKAVRKMWELDVGFGTWSEASVHPDAPMDWNAAFSADRGLVFGAETFRIFGKVLSFLTVCHVADGGMTWSHVARNRMVSQGDGSYRVTKSMAVLNL